jgi:hypothetical protein
MSYAENIIVKPMPQGEISSDDFTVNVNGKPVSVYRARVSAVPLNQIWPGYQRPLEQTEIASFAYWDMSSPVSVEILSKNSIKTVDIRPSSYGIKAEISNDRITFSMPCPKYLTVEVNGTHNALHLFANKVEEFAVDKKNPKVRYYGPGIHKAGKIILKSGETVFIEAGAIVYGVIEAKNATDIKILGRGILDASLFAREEVEGAAISLYRCEDVELNGIIIRDSPVYNVTPAACRNVNIRNLKIIGSWRYNSDGIDIVNSQDVIIEGCFVRTFDDSIVLKGMRCWPWNLSWPWNPDGCSVDDMDVRNVHISNCVVWNDWGRALEIGAETIAREMSEISFENCDVIHFIHMALDIQHSDNALIKDVRYENIHVEVDDHPLKPVFQFFIGEKYVNHEQDNFCPQMFYLGIGKMWWSHDKERGFAQNIYVKDVSVTGKNFPSSVIYGCDELHKVENVVFENLRINGMPIKSAEEGGFLIGDFADGVKFTS